MFACATLAACDVVSLDPGHPDMAIKLDTIDFERSGLTDVARVSFLIENHGTGVAYLEGCPDPVPMVIERVDAEWVVHEELNRDCRENEVPAQQVLAGLKAYRYGYDEGMIGRYRIRVSYREQEDEPGERTVLSAEFSVH